MTKLLVVNYVRFPNSVDIWDNGRCTSGYTSLTTLFKYYKTSMDAGTFHDWSQYQMPVAPEQLVWWGEE